MATTTANLGLTKPDYNDAADVAVINRNMDTIDGEVGNLRRNIETVQRELDETQADFNPSILQRDRVWNLLDNSDFRNPVNQRGETSYTGGYGIDRWRMRDSGKMTLADYGLTVQSGAVYQYHETGKFQNKPHTLAAMTTDGELLIAVMNPLDAFAYADNGLGMGIEGGNVAIALPSGRIYAWAALYEGEYTADTLPAYMPKGYASELLECMRYYVRFGSNAQMTFIGYGFSNTAGRFSIPLNVPMRETPAVTFESLSTCRIYPGSITPTSVGGKGMTGSMVTFGVSVASGITANAPAVFWPGSMVELSADL